MDVALEFDDGIDKHEKGAHRHAECDPGVTEAGDALERPGAGGVGKPEPEDHEVGQEAEENSVIDQPQISPDVRGKFPDQDIDVHQFVFPPGNIGAQEARPGEKARAQIDGPVDGIQAQPGNAGSEYQGDHRPESRPGNERFDLAEVIVERFHHRDPMSIAQAEVEGNPPAPPLSKGVGGILKPTSLEGRYFLPISLCTLSLASEIFRTS